MPRPIVIPEELAVESARRQLTVSVHQRHLDREQLRARQCRRVAQQAYARPCPCSDCQRRAPQNLLGA